MVGLSEMLSHGLIHSTLTEHHRCKVAASEQAAHDREAMENGDSKRRTCSDRAVAVATGPVLVHQVARKQRLRPYRL